MSPGMMHDKSKARFQIDTHQGLSLEDEHLMWKGQCSFCRFFALGTSHGIPPCRTREGAPAIYSGEEGR